MLAKERTSKRAASDPRYEALRARDRAADGRFYYCVKTTGVYCRPSCGARTPRPENVEFHATREAAERAGYRACKRCKPDQASLQERNRARITALCRTIEASDEMPSLATLAEQAGLSVYHLHRQFKAVTGLTPKQYAEAHRSRRVRTKLEQKQSVTRAIYDAGFQSSARFYERADALLGMKPSSYRAGGDELPIRFAVGECSLGSVLVAATERGVCAVLLGDDPAALVSDLQARFPRAEFVGGDAKFERRVATVIGLIDDPRRRVDLPLDIRGTAFQQRVWSALSKIPPGSTTTYARIAESLGAPRAVRAVAGACAANAIAVAIPCHRVVRTDGALSGYRWGIERKRALIEREARAQQEPGRSS